MCSQWHMPHSYISNMYGGPWTTRQREFTIEVVPSFFFIKETYSLTQWMVAEVPMICVLTFKPYVFQQDFQKWKKMFRFLFGRFVLAFQNGLKTLSRDTTLDTNNHNGLTQMKFPTFSMKERCQ